MTRQQRIDEAIAGAVAELRDQPYCENPTAGTTIRNIEIRFGDEGPGSWTRFDELQIEQRHLDMADAI